MFPSKGLTTQMCAQICSHWLVAYAFTFQRSRWCCFTVPPSHPACIIHRNSHFCVTVCTQISPQRRSSTRGIKSENTTPLSRFLSGWSPTKLSLSQPSCDSVFLWAVDSWDSPNRVWICSSGTRNGGPAEKIENDLKPILNQCISLQLNLPC